MLMSTQYSLGLRSAPSVVGTSSAPVGLPGATGENSASRSSLSYVSSGTSPSAAPPVGGVGGAPAAGGGTARRGSAGVGAPRTMLAICSASVAHMGARLLACAAGGTASAASSESS
jgi:hypothetical protein